MNNANLKSTLKDMLKKFEEMEKDQTAADETATSAGNSDNETNKLLGEILSEVKKFNTERESVKAELQELKATNELLLDAVTQQQRFLEELDSDRRAKNLIVIGVPENDLAVNGTTASTDREKINLVFGAINCGNPNIVSIQRLGKVNPERARPLKVVLSSAEERQDTIASASKLSESTIKVLKEMKIKKDVHPAIRKEFGRLFESERNEKAKPENAGKDVVFDKRRRLLLVDGEVVDRYKPSFF